MSTENSHTLKNEYEFLVETVFRKRSCSSCSNSADVRHEKRRDYVIEDIDWIGTRHALVDIAKFLELLSKIPMGSIPPFERGFLGWKIVMKDGNWFAGDMDSEWGTSCWSFHEVPVYPTDMLELTCIEDIIGESQEEEEEEEEEEL